MTLKSLRRTIIVVTVACAAVHGFQWFVKGEPIALAAMGWALNAAMARYEILLGMRDDA